jgi:hypothetical protein
VNLQNAVMVMFFLPALPGVRTPVSGLEREMLGASRQDQGKMPPRWQQDADLAKFARICARSRDGMTELGCGHGRKRARRSSGLEKPKELAEANFDQGSTPAIPGHGKKKRV